MSAFDKQVGGDHYKRFEIQPAEFIAKNRLCWYIGNAIKYLVRHQFKGGKQDLEKAIHYIQMAIEAYYPKQGIKLTCDQCGTEVNPDLMVYDEQDKHPFCSESCFRAFHSEDEFTEESAE